MIANEIIDSVHWKRASWNLDMFPELLQDIIECASKLNELTI